VKASLTSNVSNFAPGTRSSGLPPEYREFGMADRLSLKEKGQHSADLPTQPIDRMP
jgi:hypothetical protein